MKKIIAAIGLKNDKELTDKHFGDSAFFDIYEVTNVSSIKIKRIENTKIEERTHGDPKKASAIGTLLKGSNILVAFRMGPNILRMKKKFVPVIINSQDIEKIRTALVENYGKIFEEAQKSGERNYITLKVKED